MLYVIESDKEKILEKIKTFLWDSAVIKELAEPILWHEGDVYIFAIESDKVKGFLVYSVKNSKGNIYYCYVKPFFRRIGILTYMYAIAEKQIKDKGVTEISLISTPMSNAFFLNKGYEIQKKNIFHHKLKKNLNEPAATNN